MVGLKNNNKSSWFDRISPLAKRLVLYVVLASTFITIFTSSFQLYGIYKTEVSGIELRLDEVRDSTGDNIATRVWVANQEELEQTMRGILRLPDIEYVEIYENGERIASQGSIPSSESIERIFPLFYTFRGKSQNIGRVHVVASLEGTYQYVIDQALAIIFSNAIKTFLISAFMLFLFYKMVARHLIVLGRFAKNLDLDSLDNTLKLARKKYAGNEDEIDQLRNTLLALQRRLKSSMVELKEKQIILSNNEAKFRGVLESAVDGILMMDGNGDISLVNKALCYLTGYTSEELIGEKIEKLVPISFDKHQQLREDYLRNPKARNLGVGNVLYARRKDGTQFPVEISLTPVETADGIMIAAMVHDITVRFDTENEREELLISLEFKNEELDRFNYTVSHDLKSPLVTISGFIGLLEKDIADANMAKVESDFARIKGAAKTMQSLLDNLLELSRIGKKEVVWVNVSLDTVIEKVLGILSVNIDNSQANIVVEKNLPTIMGDETQIYEVFLNLIDNAIKYRKNDAVLEITIGVESGNENNEVVLFVKDNGVGIDARYHKKIFGLFERLSTDADGTGIGLAIVQRIVEVQGGRVWVESNGVGQGSTFKFICPNEQKRLQKTHRKYLK